MIYCAELVHEQVNSWILAWRLIVTRGGSSLINDVNEFNIINWTYLNMMTFPVETFEKICYMSGGWSLVNNF